MVSEREIDSAHPLFGDSVRSSPGVTPAFYNRLVGHACRALSVLRVVHLRASGVRIGALCSVGANCEIALGSFGARHGTIILGDRIRLERGVVLHPYGGRIEMARDVFVGPFVTIYGHGGVVIGDNTLVSMHCRILSSNHTVPASGVMIRSQPDVLLPTRIGRDVWLGAGVTVLGGVTIGDGCVVGAGAVVTENLAPNSVAIGVPARVVRRRS